MAFKAMWQKFPRISLLVNLIAGCLLGLLLISVLAKMLSSGERQAELNVLAAEPLRIDSPEEWISGKILLENRGAHRMIVAVSETGCHCSLKSDDLIIQPYEREAVEFKINARSIGSAKAVSVDITTNDPKSPVVPVLLKVVGSRSSISNSLPENAQSVLVEQL